VDELSFSSIDAEERIWLERDIEEVWEVVWDLNGDKALGPDGFAMVLF